MTPIQTNKPVFFGDDGEVLKSGKIYIGQPNQWPIDFPKTVTFKDAAGATFTAGQPLVTDSDGRISYNGKAMIALVDGDYSVLVRDHTGVTVGEGYTPFVDNSSDPSIGNVTQVGTLLTDIKKFNLTPGDTARNVGKITAIDGLGADWLVVSNTGGAADDVDLIDFTNGTQGQRVNNGLYSKDYSIAPEVASGAFSPSGPTTVWTGNSQKVLYSDLSESGTGFYVVDAGRRYMLYFIEGDPISDTSPTSVSTSYASTFTGDRSLTNFVRMGWSASDADVTITSPSILSDGTTESDSSITAIYKV